MNFYIKDQMLGSVRYTVCIYKYDILVLQLRQGVYDHVAGRLHPQKTQPYTSSWYRVSLILTQVRQREQPELIEFMWLLFVNACFYMFLGNCEICDTHAIYCACGSNWLVRYSLVWFYPKNWLKEATVDYVTTACDS